MNSQIGFAKEQCKIAIDTANKDHKYELGDEPSDSDCEKIEFPERFQLEHVQCRLFEIGSHVATPRDSEKGDEKKVYTTFDDSHIDQLEKWIDEYDATLEPLKNFILPGGGIGSASLHLCRTSCRTVERNMFKLIEENKVDENVGKYINRLSDYFFTLARVMSKKCSIADTVYINEKKAKYLEDKKKEDP